MCSGNLTFLFGLRAPFSFQKNRFETSRTQEFKGRKTPDIEFIGFGPKGERLMKRAKYQGKYSKKTKYTPVSGKDRFYKAVRTAVGVESKYYDIQVGFAIPSNVNWATTAAIAADQPQIAAGDDSFQRNGKKIVLNKIVFRGAVTTNSTAATFLAQRARIVLVQCLTQAATNVVINGTEIFGTTANGTAWNNAQTAVSASLLPGAFGKYRVLKDKMIVCQPAVSSGAAIVAEDKWFKMTVKFPANSCVLDYLTTAANSPNNYGFNLVCLADSTDYTPSLQGNLRFYYTDA